MDISIPGMNGIAATREILGRNPDIGDLLLTMLEDDDSAFAAMRAAALGYPLEDANQAEVQAAIRAREAGLGGRERGVP